MNDKMKKAAFIAMAFMLAFAGKAAAEDLTVADALKEVKVNGFASAGYNYSFNGPQSRDIKMRPFNNKDNSFGVELAQLVFHKDASEAESTGFWLDLNFGYTVPAAIHSTGYTPSGDFDIKQAYVSYVAPVGNGVKLDAGKFITEMGLEVIEGYADWGMNYSRSLLFYNTIPYTHTGVRGTYAVNDKVTLIGMITNGWDNVTDNNSGKTVCGHVMYAPDKDTMIDAKYTAGPEQADNYNMRHVFNLNASRNLTDKLTVKADYVYGFEKDAAISGDRGDASWTGSAGSGGTGNANWTGVAGYLRYALSDKAAFNVRAEIFKDSDGARTGTKQKLYEVTATPEYTVSKNMVVRAEYRHDMSSQKVFDKKEPNTSKRQDTVGLNAVYHF
ncbi:MAG: porin [Deltaproteobacteria bacterium]|nr:porin [Deltaproteobacteria bacterium]